MKKVLIAIDNENIWSKICEINKYDVYERDIVYKEGVLEYLSKNDADIVITRDDLAGDMIKELYIKQIKLIRPNIKIVLFVKIMDNKYLEFLYNNEIFDIIDSKDKVDMDKLVELMESKKIESVTTDSNYRKDEYLNNKVINIITKKKICVFGTSGAGKSYISTLLTNIISEKLNMKTLLIDFDVQNPASDIYNNLNCRNNLLMDIIKEIDNQTLNSENFHNNVYISNNRSFITNNVNMFECQNSLGVGHYEKIFEIAEQKYDVLITDIVNNISLDITYYGVKNADILMFVIQPNYISIRQAIKYLDLITNVWNIDKERIKLVVNKITERSLSIEQIEALLSGYKVIMEVKYDNNLENVINGISNIDNNMIKEDREIYKIFGVEKDNKIESNSTHKKSNFIYNLFKKEEIV